MRTAVVTDSTAYLTVEERQQYNIHVVPLSVHLEDGTYDEDKITATEFYDKVRGAKQFPKTTQPPIGRFVELFETLAEEYDEVVSIHLSSGISGTYQGAVQAGGMVENIDVYGFDTEVACGPQGMFAIEASKLAAQGASAKEILAHLEALKETMRAFIIVDDLAHLQRGGRLSAAAALIGGLLQVKPILHFHQGKIEPYEKIRTQKKALRRVEELLTEAVAQHGDLQVVVIHANCEEQGLAWLETLKQNFPAVDFKFSYFGPVIGTHLGEGSLALGWIKK